jgi:hypothetical protein
MHMGVHRSMILLDRIVTLDAQSAAELILSDRVVTLDAHSAAEHDPHGSCLGMYTVVGCSSRL